MDPREDLEELRQSLELSQAKMAEMMGISTRAYEELASGRTAVRPLHLKAAKFGAFEWIIQSKVPKHLMRRDLRETVRSLNLLLDESSS